MKRTLRWAFIASAVLCVLLVVLVLVPFLVPIDRFRPLIVHLAETNTGRTVEIGALRLYLLPNVHLEVEDLHIKNPAGFPAGDTLAIKAVDVSTTIASLLARRLDVTGVTFNGVQLNLLQTAAGKTNYAFPNPLGAGTATTPSGTQPDQAAPAFSLSRVGSITARNAKITSGTYDASAGRVAPIFSIAGLNARVGDIRLDAPNGMDAVAITSDLRGLMLSSPLLSKPVQIEKGSVSLDAGAMHATLTAVAGALRADAVIAVPNLKAPVADVDLTIPSLDVDALQALMAGGVAAAAPVPGNAGPRRLLAKGRINIGKVVARSVDASAVSAQITVYTDAVELSAFSVNAFGGTVRGTGAAHYGTGAVRAQTTLQARGLDLAGVTRALAPPGQPGMGGAVDADVRLDTALQGDPLSSMAATGTFALRNGRVPGVSKPLQIQNGTFRVEHGGARATFLAALDTLKGQGTVAVADLKHPLIAFDLTIPDIDVGRVAALVASGNAGPGRTGGGEQLVAKGALKVGRLTAAPLVATAVTCSMVVYSDKVIVDSYHLSAYGGTGRGTAVLRYAAAGAPAQGTVQLNGVDVGKLLAAVAGGGQRITGTLEANGTLSTMLTPDPLAALAGTGTFAVRNGGLPGLNLQQRFASLANLAPGALSGITTFRFFGGDFRIAQKRVDSNELKLLSDNLQATARGSAGFDQTLNYSGTGTMNGAALSKTGSQLGSLPFIGNALGGYGAAVQSIAGYTIDVPFALKGTVANPQFSAAGTPRVSRSASSGSQPSQHQPSPQPPQLPQLPGLPPIKLPQLPF